MFIGGFYGDKKSIQYTKTFIADIDYLEISNGTYDDFYVSKNQNYDDSDGYKWDYDTILYAGFDNTTNASNVDFNVNTVSHILIKRQKDGAFAWDTIAVYKIQNARDFEIQGEDFTQRSGVKYKYAAVPVQYGVEGNYSTSEVDSFFDKVYIVEKDKVIGSDLTDGFCDTSRQFGSSVMPTLNNKYPSVIRKGITNYDMGSLSLSFLEMKDCQYDSIENSYNRIMYQKDKMDFLSNGKPKLLKMFDGRMWLIEVINTPSDSANGYYGNRSINFEWVEIGDCESEEDLYYANLSDVTEEWWNK